MDDLGKKQAMDRKTQGSIIIWIVARRRENVRNTVELRGFRHMELRFSDTERSWGTQS